MQRAEDIMKSNIWDVQARESAEIAELVDRIRSVKGAISLGHRAMAMQHSPGYAEFLKAVEDVQQHLTRQLITCLKENDHMRIVQGRIWGVSDILKLLKGDKNAIAALEHQHTELQTLLTDARKRMPLAKEST